MSWLRRALVVAALTCLAVPSAALAHHGRRHDHNHFRGGNYQQTNLVSNQAGVAQLQDPNLKNAWGLAAGPTTPLWVADNGTDKATIYRGGFPNNPIAIARPPVDIPGGEPTGQVFSGTSAFGGAFFIFDSESGNIVSWSPTAGAQIARSVSGAIFKGLALAQRGGQPFLYATDFHNNKVDVFDSSFMPVSTPGGFTDHRIPAGFAPFGIQAIGRFVVVTYAKQDADAEDDVAGPGHGFVDVFTPGGFLVKRLASRGPLNSPWGVVQAPGGFGKFSHKLLIGNFGDGRINGYSRFGRFRGQLASHRKPITIDGLWGLRFGNGVAGTPQTLLFSAGPDDEANGLLGEITKGGGR
jgi:uncharacterized protein (TIGR03118 family)